MPPKRFRATEQTITKELIALMTKMRATNLRLDRGGKRYVIRCHLVTRLQTAEGGDAAGR